MRPQARLGDASSHGGTVITGSVTTLANGIPVARMCDLHVCPIPEDGVTPFVSDCLDTATDGRLNPKMVVRAGSGAAVVIGRHF